MQPVNRVLTTLQLTHRVFNAKIVAENTLNNAALGRPPGETLLFVTHDLEFASNGNSIQ